MNVYDAIRSKRAIRQFTDQPLPDEVITQILNAGRLAQSSKNLQERQFIAVSDRAKLKALSQCGTYMGHVAGAAVAVFILTPDPAEKPQLLFDAGQAASYMQLAAVDLGVGSCLGTVYEPDKVRELLEFPAEWHSRFCISFGYPTVEAAAPHPPKANGRKAFDDVIRWEKW
ncbi:MAG: nitroreductase family protein [Anaerolineae bacterium]